MVKGMVTLSSIVSGQIAWLLSNTPSFFSVVTQTDQMSRNHWRSQEKWILCWTFSRTAPCQELTACQAGACFGMHFWGGCGFPGVPERQKIRWWWNIPPGLAALPACTGGHRGGRRWNGLLCLVHASAAQWVQAAAVSSVQLLPPPPLLLSRGLSLGSTAPAAPSAPPPQPHRPALTLLQLCSALWMGA